MGALIGSNYLPLHALTLAIYAVSIGVSYLMVIRDLSVHLKPSGRIEEPWVVFIFFALAAFFRLLFSVGWSRFTLFGSTTSTAIASTQNGELAIYFSAVTFTMLGCGDFAPINSTGRWFAAYEAIFGSAHMVTFVSFILSRVGSNNCRGDAPTQVPPAT